MSRIEQEGTGWRRRNQKGAEESRRSRRVPKGAGGNMRVQEGPG